MLLPVQRTVTHPLDVVSIRRGLGPKGLDAYLVPIHPAFPNIRKSTGRVRDGVT